MDGLAVAQTATGVGRPGYKPRVKAVLVSTVFLVEAYCA